MVFRMDRLALLGVLAAASFLSGCEKAYEVVRDKAYEAVGVTTSKVKFKRLTVVVDTPQGQVSGYSVNAFIFSCGPSPMGNNCAYAQSAEAVSVKLPNGKILFALLSRGSNSEWTVLVPRQARKNLEENAERRYYKPGFYPDIVMFEHINDPKSVHFIDTSKPFEDGYSINSIFLSDDSGPQTHKIESMIPWISGIVGSFSGNTMSFLNSDDHSDRLGRSNFIQDDLHAKRS